MRKIFSILLLFMVSFLPAVSAGGAPVEEATDAAELFTVTVTLLNLETRKGSVPLLTMELPGGGTFALEAAEYCRFIDNKQQTLSPPDFGKRYRGGKVTIDFVEYSPGVNVVEECRAGTK
jgi:hypothetical protein